jgi:hypothetical protein
LTFSVTLQPARSILSHTISARLRAPHKEHSITRTRCLVAALSMLALSGCRSAPSAVPMVDDALFHRPGEVNPALLVVVQVVTPADAVSLTVRLIAQNRVYTRTLNNLPAGIFFISELASTFFNAPDLIFRAGERYPSTDVRRLRRSEQDAWGDAGRCQELSVTVAGRPRQSGCGTTPLLLAFCRRRLATRTRRHLIPDQTLSIANGRPSCDLNWTQEPQ